MLVSCYLPTELPYSMHALPFKTSNNRSATDVNPKLHRAFFSKLSEALNTCLKGSVIQNKGFAGIFLISLALSTGCVSEQAPAQDKAPSLLSKPAEKSNRLLQVSGTSDQLGNTNTTIREIEWYLADSANFKSKHWCKHNQRLEVLHH